MNRLPANEREAKVDGKEEERGYCPHRQEHGHTIVILIAVLFASSAAVASPSITAFVPSDA